MLTNFDWENTKFSVGEVKYSRMPQPLNPDFIEIPKELRKPALSTALDLSNYVEYVEQPDFYMKQIKALISGSALELQSIPNMIHFLQSQLVPQIRHIPMLPGIDAKYIPMIHALIQPTYRATNIGSQMSQKIRKNQILTDLCVFLFHHIQTNRKSWRAFNMYITGCKIYVFPALSIYGFPA